MAADFNKPATGDAHVDYASMIREKADVQAKMFDPAIVSGVLSTPIGAIRWNSAQNRDERYDGAVWQVKSVLYAINISGNAATATNADNAAAVPWSGVSSKPTTISGFGITDLVASILASFRKDNWGTNGIVAAVAGLLAWKNYGNNYVIFDASAGTAPDGTAVSATNSGSAWSTNDPVLMGWNGTATFGVRVDTARFAESATNATSTQSEGTANTTIASTAFVDRLRDVLSVPQSGSYTLALTDRGKSIDTTAGVTVPPNSTVAFGVGSTITVTNTSGSAITVTQGAGVTLRQAGTANTGNRSLAGYGVCVMRKTATDTWIISGAGLS